MAAAEVVRCQPVGGGCIHAAYRLELRDGAALFLKTGGAAALPLLQAEAEGLGALASVAQGDPLLPWIPEPLALGMLEDQALLLLPWLALDGRGGQGWRGLGQGLARLHRASLPANRGRGFGLERDNFIGSSPQLNGWSSDWGRFFVDCRLQPQLNWLARRGGSPAGAAELLKRLPAWLASHAVEPVLVHGDLWSGNAALLSGGQRGALFDPAVYWGDREVDLAMAQLFGGFPEAFFAGYAEVWPLPAGAQQRLDVYNLYHLLNHANLFDGGPGGTYGRQAQRLIEQLLVVVG